MLTEIVNGVEVPVAADKEVEIKAEWAAYDATKADYDAKKSYLDKRKIAYPSVQDQLLALWSSMDTGEIPKSKAFYEAIKAVNDQYPAPV